MKEVLYSLGARSPDKSLSLMNFPHNNILCQKCVLCNTYCILKKMKLFEVYMSYVPLDLDLVCILEAFLICETCVTINSFNFQIIKRKPGLQVIRLFHARLN